MCQQIVRTHPQHNDSVGTDQFIDCFFKDNGVETVGGIVDTFDLDRSDFFDDFGEGIVSIERNIGTDVGIMNFFVTDFFDQCPDQFRPTAESQ
ncbi:hypothetical protein SDC9_97793 [bioreactor metagenome]|uniref:Uncharacterized protein n=1 Tax=bioreactor metagenome TaxID=1076179 RepID=A0A645ADE4_9ZZZZ